jgi:hypothetical protein
MGAALVFSLFSFSGYASSSPSYKTEPVRTEVGLTTRVQVKRTVRFNQFQHQSLQPSSDLSVDFKSFASIYQCKLNVALKRYSQRQVKKKSRAQFVVQYPSENLSKT